MRENVEVAGKNAIVTKHKFFSSSNMRRTKCFLCSIVVQLT